MVQERIQGIKINDLKGLEVAGYDRDRVAMHAARLVIKEVLEDGFFHADPHPGNMLILPGEVIGLMDFGTVGYLDGSDRASLVRLYIAVIRFDVEGIIDQLIRMRIAGPSVDEEGLKRDIRRLLRRYYGLPLKEISATEIFGELTPIIYDYRLKVPSDYWLLIKTLVIMEGVGKNLAPDFDVFEVSQPYVTRFLLGLASPTSWAPSITRGALGWIDLFSNFPRQSSRILGQLERGDLSFRTEVPTLIDTTRRLNQMANRIILAIIVGTMTIALALLFPSLDLASWPWNILNWIVVLGFGFMLALAFWLILSILRSNRRS
jgi:ubiquinone biosynthesis protein